MAAISDPLGLLVMQAAPAAMVGVLLVGLVILVSLVQRQARTLQSLRLLAEQALAAQRTESETTRAAAQTVARDTADRLAVMRGTLEVGIEQIRTVLTREQGAFRLALMEAQKAGSEQIAAQFEQTRTVIDARLKEMREGNEAKLAEIRQAVHEQLHAAVEKQMTDSFARVVDQFTAVQKAMGDVQAVTAQIGDIRRLFGNVKTRGGWGEAQVRAMLDDILPPGAYEANHKVRPDSDDMVEFAVLMPMRGETRPVLSIDAKFPVEDYERLLAATETGDVEAERTATRALERRVRDEARKIAEKYIAPPATVEFAVLYLPTDALYAEIARIPGLIADIGREQRVLLMGPTLFPAQLRTIHLGFVTLALEDKADQIRHLLGATRTEMVRMDEILARLARQAGTLGNTIERARTRNRAVARKLRGIEAVDVETTNLLLELDGADDLPDDDETDAESKS
ncbi:MAG: DNA recombination protein RmuC [Acetobacteraceae bacterium]